MKVDKINEEIEMLKETIKEVGVRIANESTGFAEAASLEDKLGATMKYIVLCLWAAPLQRQWCAPAPWTLTSKLRCPVLTRPTRSCA